MTLVILLIGLAAERFFTHLVRFRRFDWLIDLAGFLRRVLPAGYAAGPVLIFLLIIPLVVVISMAINLLGYLGIIPSMLIFFYCLGPKQLEDDMDALTRAQFHADPEELRHITENMRAGKIYTGTHQDIKTRIIDALLVEANDRYFCIFFWFTIMGPAGALIYRFTSVYSQFLIQSQDPSVRLRELFVFLHKLVDWLPAQLAALSYAITGSFIHAVEQWHLTPKFQSAESVNASVLVNAGRGAVLIDSNEDLYSQAQTVLALVWRTIWVWIVLLAIITLAGWVPSENYRLG